MAKVTVAHSPRDVVPHPFPPGVRPESWVPGDVLLTHSPDGLFGPLIRFGQRLRYRSPDQRPYAWFNHAAVIVSPFEDGSPRLAEALSGGVQLTRADRYDAEWFAYIDVAASEDDRRKTCAYAERVAALRPRYGWVQIVSIALSLLTGARLTLGVDGTEICSAFAAKSLRPAGYWWERRGNVIDETYLTPADLAVSFHTERVREGAAGSSPSESAEAG